MKVIRHHCPNCKAPLKYKINIYGQQSYDCIECLTFGPWKNTIRKRIEKGSYQFNNR